MLLNRLNATLMLPECRLRVVSMWLSYRLTAAWMSSECHLGGRLNVGLMSPQCCVAVACGNKVALMLPLCLRDVFPMYPQLGFSLLECRIASISF